LVITRVLVVREHATLYGIMAASEKTATRAMTAPILPPGRSSRPRSGTGGRAAARPAARAAERTALTPESWIDAATQVLVDHGIDHVRVDVLAAELGVTRGSFYWHFRDREELLRRVLAAWRERSTEQLTARLETAHTDVRQQIRDVISLPFRGRAAARAARIELAIRAWARRDDMARAAVDESDASRIAYHVHLFASLGFTLDEARSRAFLLYGYEVAESILHRQGSDAQRRARAEFVERLLCQPLEAGAAAGGAAATGVVSPATGG
jgi:AcrR family transcriptional regulator